MDSGENLWIATLKGSQLFQFAKIHPWSNLVNTPNTELWSMQENKNIFWNTLRLYPGTPNIERSLQKNHRSHLLKTLNMGVI